MWCLSGWESTNYVSGSLFIRIIFRSVAANLQTLLQSASVLHNKFTPISYIKYTSRDFQEALEDNKDEYTDDNHDSSMNTTTCNLASDISPSMYWRLQETKNPRKLYKAPHWQRRWNIAESGRSTYELIPVVGRKPHFPNSRSANVNAIILYTTIMLSRSSQGQCTRSVFWCSTSTLAGLLSTW